MNDVGESTLNAWRKSIDAELGGIAARTTGVPARLRDAIQYSLTGGGKRLRGLLLMASYEAVRGVERASNASALAAAVEVVHAYSLIHDDLPCMDDENMRRGRETTHKAFDVPTATVAGVAMVPIAVQQTLRGAHALALDDQTASRLVGILMHASGASGMVGGQLLDLEGEDRALSAGELEAMHRAKTGALITASVVMGGIAGQGEADAVGALTAAGAALGLAFQIADDVLDATESSEALGKTAGRDAALSKSTYVSTLGVAAARQKGESLVSEAMGRLQAAGLRTPPLERLAHFVAARRS